MKQLRVLFVSLLLLLVPHYVKCRPTEQERIQLWHEAGNSWPPTWQHESARRREFMVRHIEANEIHEQYVYEYVNMLQDKREEELQLLPGKRERWENYCQVYSLYQHTIYQQSLTFLSLCSIRRVEWFHTSLSTVST